jgi:hypothetical protein
MSIVYVNPRVCGSQSPVRRVRFQPLTDEIIEAGMTRAGLPPEAIAMALGFDWSARERYLGLVADTVERYLGRPPRSVAEFLAGIEAF